MENNQKIVYGFGRLKAALELENNSVAVEILLSTDYPELNINWINEARRRFKEKYEYNYDRISQNLSIHKLDAFWFFKGNPVEPRTFNLICQALELDPEVVKECDRNV